LINQKQQQDRLHTNKDVFICYIGNKLDNFADPLVGNLVKNNAEYHIADLTFLQHAVGSAPNLYSALTQARSFEKKYLLYVELGNLVDWADGITEKIADLLDENTKFIGHILQHKNGSFYIHPQFCLFDVEWALENGIKEFNPPSGDKHNSYVYLRSDENFHDHYTPTWITPTQEIKRYKENGRGINILNKIAETEVNAKVWPREVRNRKKFVYPTVEEETVKHKATFFKEMDTARAYVGNTEDIKRDKYKKVLDLQPQKLFTPASGLNTFLLGYYAKAKHVTAYDISHTALDMIEKYIAEWDGRNYKDFFFDVINPSKITSYYYKSTGTHLDETQNLLESLGDDWVQWWQENKTIFNIATINLLDQDTWHEFKKHSYLGNVPTLLNMSNIMHYAPTATFLSLEERVQIIKNLRDYWSKNVVSPENMIVHGLNPTTGKRIQGPIRDKDLNIHFRYSWRR